MLSTCFRIVFGDDHFGLHSPPKDYPNVSPCANLLRCACPNRGHQSFQRTNAPLEGSLVIWSGRTSTQFRKPDDAKERLGNPIVPLQRLLKNAK